MILYAGSQSDGLRPTLYDFLVHRALDFFESEKYYLTKPAFKFYLDAKEDFSDAKSFVARKIQAKDSLATEFRTLMLFQDALAFHLNDKDPKALIDLDLRRLRYARSKSILNDKNLLYLERLEALKEQYKDNEASAEITFYIATYYNEQGNKYKPSPTEEYRWDIKKAYDICQEVIKKFPNSYGASHCKALANTIQYKNISLNIEKINPIGKSVLALLSYKNINKIYLKAIPVTQAQYEGFTNKYGDKQIDYLNALPSTYKWSLDLKNEGDYQNHSTEFEIPALANGRYIIAVSHNEKFTYLPMLSHLAKFLFLI